MSLSSISSKGLAAAAGVVLAGTLAVQAAQAVEVVTFVPGTYSLAETNLGPAVDTLVVSVSGGIASFVLSGTDNATFSVPDASTPTGGGGNPDYYIPGSAITASWDTSTFPYLTFWSTASSGGVTAGSIPGDQGTNFFNTFQSTQGTGQVFTVTGVPEPATWAVMLTGLAGLGAALRRTRKLAVAAA